MRFSERTFEVLLFTAISSILISDSILAAVDKETSKDKNQKSSPATPKSTHDTHNTTSSPDKLTTRFQPEKTVPSTINLPNISSSVISHKPERIVKVNTPMTTYPMSTDKLLNTFSMSPQSEITLNSKRSNTLSTIPLLEIFVKAATSSFTLSTSLLMNMSTTTQLPRISESQGTLNQEDSSSLISEGRQFKSTAVPYSYSTTTQQLSSSTYAPKIHKNDITVGYVKTSTPYSSLSKSTVLQYKSDVMTSTTSSVKASTPSTINADAVLFVSRKTTPTGTLTSSSNEKISQRPVTPSTTFVNVLWNGANQTTTSMSTTPFSHSITNSTAQNNSNTTTERNLIDNRNIIDAPKAVICPEGKMVGADDQCHENA